MRLTYLSFSVWLLLTACHHGPPPAPADARRPANGRGTVDFSAMFANTSVSRSVYTHALTRGTLDRVLLAPSVVFESSRSSLADPATTGPAAGTDQAPSLADALGYRMSFDMSSVLLRVLDEHRSTMIVPAVTRLWCGADATCASASWVERTLLLAQSQRLGERAATAALAVRALGVTSLEVPVMVTTETTRDGTIIHVAPRHDGDDATSSRCHDIELGMISLAFQAEILALPGGELAARIDEQRAFSAAGATGAYQVPDITMTEYEAVEARDPLGHRYIGSWRPVAVGCDHVRDAYATLTSALGGRLVTGSEISSMVEGALAPLYQAN